MTPSILIYGLVNSISLILTALGFSLTFGLSKVANLRTADCISSQVWRHG
jgi:branched-subunit amino acid ABC-type transport system permease component